MLKDLCASLSHVLSALLLDERLESRVISIDSCQVVSDADDCLFHVVASFDSAVLVSVPVALSEVNQGAVEETHVAVLDALAAHIDLVRVRHCLVHPLVLEAGRSGLLHGCSTHVLQRSRQCRVDLIRLLEGDVCW